ncbi:ATP-binding protein [Streptomyces sp. NPDC060235]|uniref:ATP-binding protein n=1 Tax=Streptomyces sp. NPDC060235 TaxID=3347080 RepID=UPI00366A1DC2
MQEPRRGRPLGPLSGDLTPEMTAWVIRLREFYTHLGVTLGELERLAGIDASTLSRYLSGRRLPEISFISKLDDAVFARTRSRMGAEVRTSVKELYLAACRTYEPQRYEVYMLVDAVAEAKERAERAEEAVWQLRAELQAEQQRRQELEISLRQLEARVGTFSDLEAVQQEMARVIAERDRLEVLWKQHAGELVTALREQNVVVHTHEQLMSELHTAEQILDGQLESQWGTDDPELVNGPQPPALKALPRRRRWGLRLSRSRRASLERLRQEAERAALELPTLAKRISTGNIGASDLPSLETGVYSDGEIDLVARAMSKALRAAVSLAVEHAMLANLSRRSQNLIRRQLSLISELQSREADPERLPSLFTLDFLASRMRRNGENVLVLAGEEPGPRWARPVPMLDVVRNAASESEDYERIELDSVPPIKVSGRVVNDLVHLLSELLENAVSFSSPQTLVKVTGHAVPDGRMLIQIHDAGIGLSPEELAALNQQIASPNQQIASPPALNLPVSHRMGLFVVSRLAQRHGIHVQLRPSDAGGTTALVMLPAGATQIRAEDEQAETRPTDPAEQ